MPMSGVFPGYGMTYFVIGGWLMGEGILGKIQTPIHSVNTQWDSVIQVPDESQYIYFYFKNSKSAVWEQLKQISLHYVLF
jgi:hypothetical protein